MGVCPIGLNCRVRERHRRICFRATVQCGGDPLTWLLAGPWTADRLWAAMSNLESVRAAEAFGL